MEKRNVFSATSWFSVLETASGVQTAVMTLKPGAWSDEKGNEHPGSVQILLVLEGEIKAEIGDEHATLKKGDCVIVPRRASHRFGAQGDGPAITFNVYVPPAY